MQGVAAKNDASDLSRARISDRSDHHRCLYCDDVPERPHRDGPLPAPCFSVRSCFRARADGGRRASCPRSAAHRWCGTRASVALRSWTLLRPRRRAMTGSSGLSARFGSLRKVCRPMSWSALSSLVAMPFGQLSPRKSESRACYRTNVAADKRSSGCAWSWDALLLTRVRLNFGVSSEIKHDCIGRTSSSVLRPG